jgi:hypothetical protein
MIKLAIFNKKKSKVIDTSYHIEETKYFKKNDEYEFVPIPDELIPFPIKITKISDKYICSVDENILENSLPDLLYSIRLNRNELISKTDYLMLKDVESDKDKVKEYRQYLRDFTNKITVQYLLNNNMNIKILSYEEYISSFV